MADGPETTRTSTRPLFAVPHLAVSEVRWRHDLGDEIARRAGTPVVTTACGQEVMSTLTTRRTDRVCCPDCASTVKKTQ